MRVLYDTRTVHPLDRYDYYRAGAGAELAPVTVDGRSPGRLLAAMSVARIGDFEIEAVTWAADSEVVARRTHRLIRSCDPECYRPGLQTAVRRLGDRGAQARIRIGGVSRVPTESRGPLAAHQGPIPW
jgi:hypothetical protein